MRKTISYCLRTDYSPWLRPTTYSDHFEVTHCEINKRIVSLKAVPWTCLENNGLIVYPFIPLPLWVGGHKTTVTTPYRPLCNKIPYAKHC